MARATKKKLPSLFDEKPRKKSAEHVTRGKDADGRTVDYVRHEACKGHGCPQCNGYGFTKQLVMDV